MIAAAAAVLAAAVLGVLGWLVHRAASLERVLKASDRDEADLEALAAVSEPRDCGCQWVPCDKHVDRLLRVLRKDEEEL